MAIGRVVVDSGDAINRAAPLIWRRQLAVCETAATATR